MVVLPLPGIPQRMIRRPPRAFGTADPQYLTSEKPFLTSRSAAAYCLRLGVYPRLTMKTKQAAPKMPSDASAKVLMSV